MYIIYIIYNIVKGPKITGKMKYPMVILWLSYGYPMVRVVVWS